MKSLNHKQKQSRYLRTRAKILLERENVCAGCGSYRHLTGSHRIPRSLCVGSATELYWDEHNIDLLCLDCHDKMYAPRMADLDNFLEILNYYREWSHLTGSLKSLAKRTERYVKTDQEIS